MFRGTFTALVTPFAGDGRVDEAALVRDVSRQLAAGVDGLVLFRETAALELSSRRQVLELVQKKTEGHVFVVAAAFDGDGARAAQLAREMDWVGVDAILCALPAGATPDEATSAVRRVADGVESPVLLSSALATLSPENVARLAESGHLHGLDDGCDDLDYASSVAAATDEDFSLVCGDDVLTVPMIQRGARGLISTIANETPDRIRRLVELALDGDVAAARRAHRELFGGPPSDPSSPG